VTDVLSFLYTKGNGEIIICFEEVKKNASRLGTRFKEELAEVLIHGILHILGYSHETSKKKEREMIRKQKYYLKLFFKKRAK
jgi:probable rRNA maturation factor